MRNDEKTGGKAVLLNAVVIFACFIAVFPVFIMITGSLKTSQELYTNSAGFPVHPTLANFKRLLSFNSGLILRTFGNSIFVAASYTALSCLWPPWQGMHLQSSNSVAEMLLFLLLLITMMIPAELNITPLYLIFPK